MCDVRRDVFTCIHFSVIPLLSPIISCIQNVLALAFDSLKARHMIRNISTILRLL